MLWIKKTLYLLLLLYSKSIWLFIAFGQMRKSRRKTSLSFIQLVNFANCKLSLFFCPISAELKLNCELAREGDRLIYYSSNRLRLFCVSTTRRVFDFIDYSVDTTRRFFNVIWKTLLTVILFRIECQQSRSRARSHLHKFSRWICIKWYEKSFFYLIDRLFVFSITIASSIYITRLDPHNEEDWRVTVKIMLIS